MRTYPRQLRVSFSTVRAALCTSVADTTAGADIILFYLSAWFQPPYEMNLDAALLLLRRTLQPRRPGVPEKSWHIVWENQRSERTSTSGELSSCRLNLYEANSDPASDRQFRPGLS